MFNYNPYTGEKINYVEAFDIVSKKIDELILKTDRVLEKQVASDKLLRDYLQGQDQKAKHAANVLSIRTLDKSEGA